MHSSHFSAAGVAIISLTFISGCSNGASQLPRSESPAYQYWLRQYVPSDAAGATRSLGPVQYRAERSGWLDPHAKSTGLAFFSDWGNAVINIFSTETLKQVGQITSVCEPDGLATDKQGNLYEADQCSHRVQIYAPNDVEKPTSTIPDFGYLPVGITVDAGGNIYVANIETNVGGQGNVVRIDAKTHIRTVLRGAPYFPFCITTDAFGNVWADGQSYHGYAVVGYWSKGSGSFNHVNISFKFPGQLQFDGSGNLLLDDQSGSPNGGSEIFVYPPGSTNPIRSVPIQNDGSDIVSFVLGKDNERVFVPDVTNSEIYLYGYESGDLLATLHPSLAGGSLIGAAVIPAPLP